LDDVKSDLRLLILAREFPTASGPIDALGVDGDGDIYVIETKRYENPDKRLVLAQVLDYGASLWASYGDLAAFVARLDTSSRSGHGLTVAEKLQDFYGLDSEGVLEILEAVRANLSQAKFRFVVLMDRLDDRLKTLISFVNANSRFDVYGVELDFYQHDEFEIIIPTLYGAEAKKEVAAGASSQKWNLESFFADAERRVSPEHLPALRSLYEWAKENASEIGWGSGKKTGSFSIRLFDVSARSVLSVYSSGLLQLNFKWLTDDDVSNEFANCFGSDLAQQPGLQLPNDYLSKYPSIKPDVWVPRIQAIIGVVERNRPSAKSA
jgi:hypothetical protein